MDIDIDRLVTEVNSLPLLWNSADADYKDRNKKEVAWATVTRLLFEKYDAEDDGKKKIFVEFVKQKWKCLRDGYTRWRRGVKTVRTGSKASKKRYIYADILSFLNVNAEPRDTESSHDSSMVDNDNEENTFFEEDKILNELRSEDGVQRLLPKETSSTHEDDPTPQTCNRLQKRKSPSKYAYNTKKPKQTKLELEMSEYFQLAKSRLNVQQPTIDDNEDLHFFKSLIPSLRELTIQQKLQFRMQVMSALDAILQQRTNLVSDTPMYTHTNIPSQHFPNSQQFFNPQQYPHLHMSSSSSLSPHYPPSTPLSHLGTPAPSPRSVASSTPSHASGTILDYHIPEDTS